MTRLAPERTWPGLALLLAACAAPPPVAQPPAAAPAAASMAPPTAAVEETPPAPDAETPPAPPAAAESVFAGKATQRVVDFENIPLGGQTSLAVPSPFVVAADNDPEWVVTIRGPALAVYDLFRFGHEETTRGQALLNWTGDGAAASAVTSFRFSAPVVAATLVAGDFHGDDDGPLEVVALDRTGQEVARDAVPWPENQGPPFARLLVRANEICGLRFRSGGQHPNSAFVDDLVVELAAPAARQRGQCPP